MLLNSLSLQLINSLWYRAILTYVGGRREENTGNLHHLASPFSLVKEALGVSQTTLNNMGLQLELP